MSWEELERPAPDVVVVEGTEVRRGSRVRLRPRAGGDIFDRALAGRVGVVESIEQDMDDAVHLVVVAEDDPGRDLGERRQPGHRFFFAADEVEPLGDGEAEGDERARTKFALEGSTKSDGEAEGDERARTKFALEGSTKSILVAGIGNVFLGDDGFGVALAGRLAARALPAGVKVVDYGIRGMDLAYALGDGWDAVVLLDATPRGGAPGTLYVIEAQVGDDAGVPIDAHGMDPVKVVALARALGASPPRTLVVGCEPQTRMTGDEDEVVADLSEPVRAALDEAERLVGEVLQDLLTHERSPS